MNIFSNEPGLDTVDGGNTEVARAVFSDWSEDPMDELPSTIYKIFRTPDGSLGMKKSILPGIKVEINHNPHNALRMIERENSLTAAADVENELGLSFVSQAEGEWVLFRLESAGPRQDTGWLLGEGATETNFPA